MTFSGFNSGTLVNFIDQKSQTVYHWLKFSTPSNLPLSFYEHSTVDKYTTTQQISTETLSQENQLTHLDVRDIFDVLTGIHPTIDKYLAADAAILKYRVFKEYCVLALAGRRNLYTDDQQQMLQPFETTTATEKSHRCATDGRPQAFLDGEFATRKNQRPAKKKYEGVHHIPPTCNAVEKLFSAAKHTLSHHRQRILPVHLKPVLFQKLNRCFWSATTVVKVIHRG